MRLFDLHTDTATRLYDGLSFSDGSLQASALDLSAFDAVTQVFACFSRPQLSDDLAYSAFFATRKRLFDEIRPYVGRLTPILAVEDARLLGTSRTRLGRLSDAGVRILTLLWRGETTIGGAYDTQSGLTEFGKGVLADCFGLGILPDASHASEAAFYDIAEGAADRGLPFLATHSNARAVCDHPRNLYDEQYRTVCRSGGLVGLCLYPPHLTERRVATSYDAIAHIEHLLSLGGENSLCLGTDFDGIEETPADIPKMRHLYVLRDRLASLGYSDELIQKIFWKNAEDFFGKYNENRNDYELQKYKKSDK